MTTPGKLRFGIFDQVPVGPSQTAAVRYGEVLAQAEAADRLGFDTAWFAEAHFAPAFSALPAPLLLAAALSQRTQDIRLGTAASLLPLHHPVRLAEEAAMVDVLSGGRLELGVGRGPAPLYARGFDVPSHESRARFDEALEVLAAIWRDGLVNHEGRFFRVRGVEVSPKPLQQPRPPVYVVANSRDTVVAAGRRGCAIMVSSGVHPWPDPLLAHLGAYREALGGLPGRVAAVFYVSTAPSTGEARARLEPSLSHYFEVVRGEAIPLDAVEQGSAIVGTPAECLAKMERIMASAAIDEVVCWFNPGGLVPHATVLDGMALFAREVVPGARALARHQRGRYLDRARL